MKATAQTIWRVPAYLAYLQPTLTDEAVDEAQQMLGVVLPEEYLRLLRQQNGGYIRFELPESVHDTMAGIGRGFPSLTEFDGDDCQEYGSFQLQGLVPFDGDGHWHLCLDYRENENTPAITLVDIECDSETRVANSFANYLSMLRIRVKGQHVLESVSSVAELKVALSLQLGVVFDAPDNWAHGYPVEFARLGDSQSLWISPNTAPRGFVRQDDPLYLELKDLMPGVSERFPGLPRDSYLLESTDGVRAKVLDACHRLGYAARPLGEYMHNA